MKCPYCGGEVSSQSLKCPYCGADNPEGVAFQEELQKKIDRNKLLRPFLIKQRTPELVQRMLTRIMIILAAINIVLFGFSIGIYIWGERDIVRVAGQGSIAQRYELTFMENQNYYYDSFLREMNELIDLMEEGQVPERRKLTYFLDDAYDALYFTQNESEATRQEVLLTVKAFLMGYVGLTEQEMEGFAPDQNGTYELYMDDAVLEQTVTVMEEKIKEAVK